MLVTTTVFESVIMNVKASFFNGLTSFYVGLFTNNITLTRNTNQSLLTEPTVPGYSRVIGAPGFGTAYLNASGFWQIDKAALCIFTPSSVTAGQNVYGYFVGNPANGLLWAETNPAGPVLWGNTLLPYIVQVSFQESQFNQTNP